MNKKYRMLCVVLGGSIGYGSAWRACIALVRIQLPTERFCEGNPDN